MGKRKWRAERGCKVKRRYASYEDAEKAALKAIHQIGGFYDVYHCRRCGGWHVGSQTEMRAGNVSTEELQRRAMALFQVGSTSEDVVGALMDEYGVNDRRAMMNMTAARKRLGYTRAQALYGHQQSEHENDKPTS